MSFMSIIVYMLGALIFILFSTDLSNIQIKGTCRLPPACRPGFRFSTVGHGGGGGR
jgi:hypothetical protein